MGNKDKKVDIYRDTPLRYLGYANEVGESFRGLVAPPIVTFSYILASGYVVADAIAKGVEMYQTTPHPDKYKKTLLSGTDTLLWQAFASVIIPGYTINRLCAGIHFLQRRSSITMLRNPWLCTAVGLASIPFIIKPIDTLVEEGMNLSYRKITGFHPK